MATGDRRKVFPFRLAMDVDWNDQEQNSPCPGRWSGNAGLIFLGAGLQAVFINRSTELEKIDLMPDGGQTIYRNGIAISVPQRRPYKTQ
jgi:hypothetical protein